MRKKGSSLEPFWGCSSSRGRVLYISGVRPAECRLEGGDGSPEQGLEEVAWGWSGDLQEAGPERSQEVECVRRDPSHGGGGRARTMPEQGLKEMESVVREEGEHEREWSRVGKG